jgi:hypothetical protein
MSNIKLAQAYIYGASVALQENGMSKKAADDYAMKIALNIPELAAALKGHAGSAVNAVGGAARSAGGALRSGAGHAADFMGNAAGSVGNAARSAYSGMGNAASSIGNAASSGMGSARETLSALFGAQGKVPTMVKNNPYSALGAGAAVGAGGGMGLSALLNRGDNDGDEG